MDRDAEITAKFWKALRSDMTVMLGIGHAMRPMTAQLAEEEDHGPIWFFSTVENDLVEGVGAGAKDAHISFVDKGHNLFALVQGRLQVDTDRGMVDRLWNRYVAAWYEGGKEDPKLRLLRFDPKDAEIWLDESSFLAGIKLMLGMDPKKDYAESKADVRLS